METEQETVVENVEQVQEVVPQQEAAVAQAEVQPEAVPEQQAAGEQSVQNVRFETLREARQKAEQERDNLRRQLEYLQMQQQVGQQPQAQQAQQQFQIGDNDYVQGVHLKKQFEAMEAKQQRHLDELKERTINASIAVECPDYDKVVTPENLAVLEKAYPQVAATLNASTDKYNNRKTAYTLMKNLGIASSQSHDKAVAQAKVNSQAPLPSTSVKQQQGGGGPISHLNSFADSSAPESRELTYQQMLKDAGRG